MNTSSRLHVRSRLGQDAIHVRPASRVVAVALPSSHGLSSPLSSITIIQPLSLSSSPFYLSLRFFFLSHFLSSLYNYPIVSLSFPFPLSSLLSLAIFNFSLPQPSNPSFAFLPLYLLSSIIFILSLSSPSLLPYRSSPIPRSLKFYYFFSLRHSHHLQSLLFLNCLSSDSPLLSVHFHSLHRFLHFTFFFFLSLFTLFLSSFLIATGFYHLPPSIPLPYTYYLRSVTPHFQVTFAVILKYLMCFE